jgi:hypothetical protein
VKESDWAEFCSILGVTAELCGVQKPTKDATDFYFLMLRGLCSIEDFKKAVTWHLQRSPFFPKPADIIKQIHGTVEIRALEAWMLVMTAVKRYGHSSSIKFSNPAIHWVIERMGGWEYFSPRLTEENQGFIERDFCRLYEKAEKVATWENSPFYLMGRSERENRQGGFTEFLPDVIDVESGEYIDRKTLALVSEHDKLAQLPDVEIKRLEVG